MKPVFCDFFILGLYGIRKRSLAEQNLLDSIKIQSEMQSQ